MTFMHLSPRIARTLDAPGVWVVILNSFEGGRDGLVLPVSHLGPVRWEPACYFAVNLRRGGWRGPLRGLAADLRPTFEGQGRRRSVLLEDLAAGPFGDKCARCIGRHPASGRSGASGTRRLVTL